MDLKLTNKVVIILASSDGLGKASALEFASEGAQVLISSRNESKLKTAVNEIEQTTNGKVDYFPADVSKKEDIEALVRTTAEKYGSVDILVNNAGGPPAGTFKDFTDDDWQQSFELHLLSYIRSIREVLPYMQKQKSGRIINIASSSIKQPIDNLILSNTFRNGIAGLAKSLAGELATYNILINTIGPGIIKTNRVTEVDKINAQKVGTSLEAIETEKLKQIPLGRYGEPDEFAKMLVYLASFANTYVTGQSLLVEGGMVKAL